MLRATKVRINPTQVQAEFLITHSDAMRSVYNKALYLKSHLHRKHGFTLKFKKGIKPLLDVVNKSQKHPWLKQYDSIVLPQSVIILQQAFDNFFNPKLKAKSPQFKHRHCKQSSYHCMGVKVLDEVVASIRLNIVSKVSFSVDLTLPLNETAERQQTQVLS